jgi:hypothetical protein
MEYWPALARHTENLKQVFPYLDKFSIDSIYAKNGLGQGIMECWKVGFGGRRSVFYMDCTEWEIKIDHHPLLIPNTPSIQYYRIETFKTF